MNATMPARPARLASILLIPLVAGCFQSLGPDVPGDPSAAARPTGGARDAGVTDTSIGGGADGGGPTGDALPGGDPEITAVCGDVAAAICEKLSECFNSLVSTLFGTVERCKERQRLSCSVALRAPGIAATPASYRACLPAYRKLACTDPGLDEGMERIPACAPRPGSLPEKAICNSNYQCASASCRPSGGSPWCGTCGRPPEPGAEGGVCLADRTCTSTLRCSDGICLKTKTAELGERCDTGRYCSLGLACINKKCVKTARPGEACDTTGVTAKPCDDLALCSGDPPKCQAVQYAKVGQPCGDVRTGEKSEIVLCDGESWCPKDTGSGSKCAPRTPDGSKCADASETDCFELSRCIKGVCQIPDVAICK